jgi:hypothetical protein
MKQRTSYSLSQEAKDLLAQLSKHFAISQAATLEIIIRQTAKSEGIKIQKDSTKTPS